jgi:hypothetical protein
MLKTLLSLILTSVLISHSFCSDKGNAASREWTLHYTLSTAITFTSSTAIYFIRPDLPQKSKYLISSGIGLAVGVGKEMYDVFSGGYFDLYDFGFDLLGIASGLLLHFCMFDLKNSKGTLSLNLVDPERLACVKISF